MRKRTPILMYHIVGSPPPGALVPLQYVTVGLLRSHLRVLSALGYESSPMDSLYQANDRKRRAVVTFDDAYENVYTDAIPLLKELGFTATLFVVANQIGGSNAWDVALGDVPHKLMNRDQILEVAKDGFEIGAHTLDHTNLAKVDRGESERQVRDSKEILSDLISDPVRSFCYPYGGLTSETASIVKEAGFVAACTVEHGINDLGTNPYLLKRINCPPTLTATKLAFQLARLGSIGR